MIELRALVWNTASHRVHARGNEIQLSLLLSGIDEVGQRSDLAGPVSQLDQQATRMQGLVEDLLDLSRIVFVERSSRMTRVDVPVMVGAIVDDM